MNGFRMRLSARLPLYIALWLVAEIVAFAVVAHAAGFGGAMFLCLLTSLVGVAMLRRLGLSTAFRLRRAMATRSHEEAGLSREAVVDGTLVGVGSILLILPGFVSDFFGLALAAPSVRGWLSDRIQKGGTSRGRGGRKAGPALVDLDPQEWSRLDNPGAAAPQPKLRATKARPRSPRGA
ncbi:FxsA cytoplasmic membrane protein [Methylocella tundrae]|nr:FxsA cytoplasmic membrane protein [Methylocella tundrae]